MGENHNKTKKDFSLPLIISALGVVFGDIGTSPLYTIKVTFFGPHPLAVNTQNVLGVLSLIFWSLMIVVTIKYILLIMRANNKGEGGLFALLALLRKENINKFLGIKVIFIVFLGASLLYGDGVITPAISVLSAVEGFEILSPNLSRYVVPLAIIILIVLFSIQKKGTGKVGKFFGPVMICWFISLIALGLPQIIKHPQVLNAINPLSAYKFIANHAWYTFFVLGSVALCVTGCEALYADMGHFSHKSIAWAWTGLAYPALVINYFGQGTVLLSGGPISDNNTFYALAPQWAFLGVVFLATVATIIASQALISGAFSLTRQGVALGLLPKIKIVHTNPEIKGQIYIPFVNIALATGCILLVLAFRTSEGLAAAYGLAVTGTMVITTIIFYLIVHKLWKWPLAVVAPVIAFLFVADLSFFFSTLLKFWQGGFVPFIIAIVLFAIMAVWDWGRRLSRAAHLNLPGISIGKFAELQALHSKNLLNRSVVIMSSRYIASNDERIPAALDSFLSKWGMVIPKHLIFLNVVSENCPQVEKDKRYNITSFQNNENAGSIISIRAFYGYMESPSIRNFLTELKEQGKIKIPKDPAKWLVLVASDRFVAKPKNPFKYMRIALLNFLVSNVKPITNYYGLDHDNKVVIETINIQNFELNKKKQEII